MRTPRLVASLIAGFGLVRVLPTPKETEAGVLVHPVRYEKLLDDVGEDPAVSLPRRRREDCRSYRLRLQLHLQEQIMLREHLDRLLEKLFASERS